MLSGVDYNRMKLGIGLFLSLIFWLCTDFSTAFVANLTQALSWDAVVLIKALMIVALLGLLFLSLWLAEYRQRLPAVRIQKVLALKEALKSLDHPDVALEKKLKHSNQLLKKLRSNVDFVSHYPSISFEPVLSEEDYTSSSVTVLRAINIYIETLSDGYYRLQYFSAH